MMKQTWRRHLLLIALQVIYASPPALAAPNAVKASERPDGAAHLPAAQTQTVEQIGSAATRGDAEAQYRLSQMYGTGEGVPKDPPTAALWLQKAADQGHVKAQASLGTAYLFGEGLPKNAGMAVHWLGKAAQQGDVMAQTNLGAMYLNGDGVPQNFRMALTWLEKAAAQHYPLAQYSLGLMYQNGFGVRTDETMAAQLFAKSAAQNYALAKQALDKLTYTLAAQTAKATGGVVPPSQVQAQRPASDQPAQTGQSEQAVILKTVQGWAAAWSARDVDGYLGYYAPDFQTPNGESRGDWAALRRSRIGNRQRISVAVEAPQIAIDGDRAAVTFTQKYSTDNHAETSRKTLALARQANDWKIIRESSGAKKK